MSADKEIGFIKWLATSTKSMDFMEEGESQIWIDDVVITPLSSPMKRSKSESKLVKLGLDFEFGISGGGSETEDRSGFGFTACNATERPSFSWEWFVIDSPGHAVKLQETGEVAFETEKVGERWEIVRTEFLTDVSMRIVRMGFDKFKLSTKGVDLEFDWRLKICKGSTVHWPVLVDGEKILCKK